MVATDPTGTVGPDAVSREAVVERLDRVDDPELDRSIVELAYIDEVRIDGRHVSVGVVLPTAWCSPAFAWMMATGIRDEVEALSAVEGVTVDLRDHMHAEEINTGVNERLAFETVFEDADEGVETVERTLDERARFARQYAALNALTDAGLDPAQIAALTLGDVDLSFDEDRAAVSLRDGALSVALPSDPLADYVEKARATGVVTRGTDPLFTDRAGDPLVAEAFETVRRDARVARSNIEGQAAICASLHEARNGGGADD